MERRGCFSGSSACDIDKDRDNGNGDADSTTSSLGASICAAADVKSTTGAETVVAVTSPTAAAVAGAVAVIVVTTDSAGNDNGGDACVSHACVSLRGGKKPSQDTAESGLLGDTGVSKPLCAMTSKSGPPSTGTWSGFGGHTTR